MWIFVISKRANIERNMCVCYVCMLCGIEAIVGWSVCFHTTGIEEPTCWHNVQTDTQLRWGRSFYKHSTPKISDSIQYTNSNLQRPYQKVIACNMRFGRCSPKVIVGVSKFWPQNSKVVGVFTDVEDGVVESVVDSWVTADSSATAWHQQFHQSGDKLDLFGHSFESVYSKFIVAFTLTNAFNSLVHFAIWQFLLLCWKSQL